MYDIHIKDGQVIACTVSEQTLTTTISFERMEFACNAVFRDASVAGISFQKIKVAQGSSILFEDCNLSSTDWGWGVLPADTSRVTFRKVDLSHSNITVHQLGWAVDLTPDCIFPHGIDYRKVVEHQKKLLIRPFATPYPA